MEIMIDSGALCEGFDRSAMLNLFTFIDWIMILPEAVKVSFWQELKVYEEQRQMPYITSVEQIGYDWGRQVGWESGVENERDSIALNLLRQGIAIEVIVQATGLTIVQIQRLQTQLGQN